MSAYAEDAYGKSGFFMVFYLYFFSLAIGNVAIAISAVGYLATAGGLLAIPEPDSLILGGVGLWLLAFARRGAGRAYSSSITES